MSKKLLLLAGLLVLGATSFSAETVEEGKKQEVITSETSVEIITENDSDTVKKLVAGRQTGEEGFSGSYFAEISTSMSQGPGRSDKTGDLYTHESLNSISTTLAEGKLNMGKLGIFYGAYRDDNFNKDWDKTSESWSVESGFDYQAGNFDMMGKEWTFVPSVLFGYEKTQNITSKSAESGKYDYESDRWVKFTPKISTTHYGFATDISPIVYYDDITGTVAFQLDISTFRKLNDSWSTYGGIYFDFAGTESDKSTTNGKKTYANGVFANGGIDEDNKFDLSLEQYLKYEKNVVGSLYFSTTFGLEAYSLLQSEKNDVSLFVNPKLAYRAKMGQVNVTPYVEYTAYTATGGYVSTGNATGRDELTIGVTLGTKF